MTQRDDSDRWLTRARDVTITGTLWAAWGLFWLTVLRAGAPYR